MTYIPPFEAVRQLLEISAAKGELRVSASYDEFVEILKSFLRAVPVDADFYLGHYPDIAAAHAAGSVASLSGHYADSGYFEGRLPSPVAVDEAWYLENNPDVADGIRRGVIKSAEEHFIRDGYREGRRPSAP